MIIDDLKLLLQDPVIKQTLVNIIITALDQRDREKVRKTIESFREFDRPTSLRKEQVE